MTGHSTDHLLAPDHLQTRSQRLARTSVSSVIRSVPLIPPPLETSGVYRPHLHLASVSVGVGIDVGGTS